MTPHTASQESFCLLPSQIPEGPLSSGSPSSAISSPHSGSLRGPDEASPNGPLTLLDTAIVGTIAKIRDSNFVLIIVFYILKKNNKDLETE